jgi:pyruvate dehydrogenase E2 component (dihydrolipoamide acetyltransferase)
MKFLEAKRLKPEPENKALGGPSTDKTDKVSGSAPAGPSASPQARQLAREQNIDLESLKGTGVGGTITAADVRQAIEAKGRSNPADFKSGGGIGRD